MSLKSQNKINPNFSMSSMTDIVFLLLVFFMIASTLVTTHALKIELPTSSSAEVLKEQTLSITIKDDVVGDNKYTYLINTESVEKESLASKLIELKEKDNQMIVLRAEKTISIEAVVDIINLANENDYKIVLATTPN